MPAVRDARGLETMTAEIQEAAHYYRWIHDAIRPALGRRVLEVGPGYGNLGALLAAEGREVLGVDLDAGVIEELSARFAGTPRLRFRCADVRTRSVQDELRAEAFDTVVSFNVLEHLEDPGALLASLAQCAPGATLLVFVPAHPVLYGTLDEQAGHFRRYRRGELTALVARYAEVERVRYFNAVGALAWFVAGRILRLPLNGEATGRSISLYDRVVVPIARLVDPAGARFFGQSLLLTSRFRHVAPPPGR
jgi:SAM-dependent methyltransferase